MTSTTMPRNAFVVLALLLLNATCKTDDAASASDGLDAASKAPTTGEIDDASLATANVDATDDALADVVVETERFTLRSSFAFNLHDRLTQWSLRVIGEADHAGDDAEGAACIAALSEDARNGWEAAVVEYGALHRKVGAPTPGVVQGGFLGLVLRYELIEPGFSVRGETSAPEWFRPAFARAADAYRQCWWADDNRSNRAYIASAKPTLIALEEKMVAGLSAAHAVTWPEGRHVVDIVPVVRWEGADTVVRPNHTLIGSTMAGNDGPGALEMLFHEATHTVVSPRGGGSVDALNAAATAAAVELPRGLWHAVLFFVAGRLAEQALADIGAPPYRQYGYSQEVFTRVWPDLIGPLEDVWGPYLDGAYDLTRAAALLVARVGIPPGATAAP